MNMNAEAGPSRPKAVHYVNEYVSYEPQLSTDYEQAYRGADTPIVLDNGPSGP